MKYFTFEVTNLRKLNIFYKIPQCVYDLFIYFLLYFYF